MGRQEWLVEWDWNHPDEGKRRGQSPSSHLKIVRTELEERRRTVRAGTPGADSNSGGGGGAAADEEDEDDEDDDVVTDSEQEDNIDDDEEEEEFDNEETCCNEQEWEKVDIGFELGSESVRNKGSFNVKDFPRVESREHLDYFMYMFPPRMNEIIAIGIVSSVSSRKLYQSSTSINRLRV